MLQIRVLSVDGQPPSFPMVARFGSAGGTIGRNEGNTLVLPDEAKTVSRQHAVIQVQGGQFVLLDRGANPTLRNHVPVGPSQIAPLAIGDELRIGPYVLVVESPGSPAIDSDTAPAAFDPFAPRQAAPAAPAPDAQVGPSATAYPSPAPRRVPPPIPFERDSAEDLPEARDETPAPASRLVTVPPPLPPSVSPQAIDDLLASVGSLDPSDAAGQAKPATPVRAPAPPATPTSPDTLLAAFSQGLGAPLNLPEGITEEFMYRMGTLLREAVKGTVDLLNARAITKRDVKASATVIVQRHNNPLKFSPDPQTALLYLVAGRLNPAFMPPLGALRDAYNDLRSHQSGVVAGTRAALLGVLERFEPERVERRLVGRGLVESLIPTARKARLWDQFNELYKEIAAEAGDDFDVLFGRAFLKAYEEHVEALRRNMPDESPGA